MSVWIKSCRGRDLIRAVVRDLAWDRAHDPWGSGVSALGTLADAAWFFGEDVESEGTTPAVGQHPGGDWIEHDEHEAARELVVAILEGQASRDDLAYGIRWVDRYVTLVRAAGHDY